MDELIIFLRHPTPEVPQGMCYGQTDLDIAEIGHEQIIRAREITPKVTHILASPALRCRKLAMTIAERDGLEITFDERLWEMDMGEWEGVMWKDIDQKISVPWSRDPVNIPTPGGECFKDVQLRVLEALSSAHADTAIICHAGPIRAVQMMWENKSFSDVFAKTPTYAEPIILHPPE